MSLVVVFRLRFFDNNNHGCGNYNTSGYSMNMIFQRLIFIIATAACLVYEKRAHSFITRSGSNNVRATNDRGTLLALAAAAEAMEMPEALPDMGCDIELWNKMPPGAQRDLGRFCRTGKDDLARNRVETMKDILPFVKTPEDGLWEMKAWEKGVSAWEANEEAEREAAIAKAKAERRERAKAAATAREAESKAKAEAAAQAEEIEDNFQ